ncbi:hypothetical protein EVAR_2271_1 [Eumeta japonica]|uniref:Uncharacterized protein n=1 Tax=Eumeta variegata TaxID=151549 RepID=A0A4C1SFN4_EUMVA|nr:hypothetical protein EVAR_2271_1 [Eumeta japonica]
MFNFIKERRSHPQRSTKEARLATGGVTSLSGIPPRSTVRDRWTADCSLTKSFLVSIHLRLRRDQRRSRSSGVRFGIVFRRPKVDCLPHGPHGPGGSAHPTTPDYFV